MNVFDSYKNLVEACKADSPSNWDGTIPQSWKPTCKACGKPLNADGNHPAEVYLGTFNGLCYPCTSASVYRVAVLRDGVQQWSFPPYCPSWRRDRETYFGYSGCETCQGMGGIWATRRLSDGGGYRKNCETCFKRYIEEPLRARAEKWSMGIYKAAIRIFKERQETWKKKLKLKKKDKLSDEAVESIRVEVLAKFRRVEAKLKIWRERKQVYG